MTKKTEKQVRFEFNLMSLATWAKILEDNEEKEFSEPERFKTNLHVLYYKLKELVNSYEEIRKHTLSLVAEYMWKDIQNEIERLYKEQEE